jgi:hypothetical protein
MTRLKARTDRELRRDLLAEFYLSLAPNQGSDD